ASDSPPFACGPVSYNPPRKRGRHPRGSSLCERTTGAPVRHGHSDPPPFAPGRACPMSVTNVLGAGLLQFPAQTRGGRPRARRSFHSTRGRRSLPKYISTVSTKNVGEPKPPRATSSSVLARSRSL